jgi:hypothetical protein
MKVNTIKTRINHHMKRTYYDSELNFQINTVSIRGYTEINSALLSNKCDQKKPRTQTKKHLLINLSRNKNDK